MKRNADEPFIPKHGDYRKLKSFQVAEVIYDITAHKIHDVNGQLEIPVEKADLVGIRLSNVKNALLIFVSD